MQELEAKYLEVLEAHEWNVIGYTDDGRVELEWFSPAGEDFIICVDVDDFPKKMREYYFDFDPDEHVEMWAEAKRNGRGGIPTIRRLAYDADDIDEELNELTAELLEVQK